MDKVIWQQFIKSSEFLNLKNYADKEIKLIINNLFEFAHQNNEDDISKWDEEFIFSVLISVEEQAENDGDFESFMVFKSFYEVVKEFLKFSSAQGIISITVDDMNDLLTVFERHVGIQGDEVIDQHYDPSLPQWLEYVSNNISQYTQDWVDAYVESSDWNHRAKGVTENLLSLSMSALTDKAYDIYRKTPKTWTKKVIHGVLTGYFVSNVGFDTDDYRYIVPALTGLLTYVGKQGWVNEKRIDNFKRYLAASEDEMVELASDTNNFGPSKIIATKMMEQGIDFNDEAAVNEFIKQVNANGGVDSLRNDNKTLTDELNLNSNQIEEVAKAYDPDPERRYLSDPHIEMNGIRRWNKITAVKNHADGVEYGFKLWNKRQDYGLPESITAPDVVVTVSQITDVLYAQHLETLDLWTFRTWKEFGAWIKEGQSSAEYARTSNLLTALFQMLSTENLLSQSMSKKLISVFEAKIIPFNQVKRVKGKLRKKKNKRK